MCAAWLCVIQQAMLRCMSPHLAEQHFYIAPTLLAAEAESLPICGNQSMHTLCRRARFTGREDAEWRDFQSALLEFWHAILTNTDGADPASDMQAAETADEASAWQRLKCRHAAQRLLTGATHAAFAALNKANLSHAADGAVTKQCQSDVTGITGTARSTAADTLGALHSVFEELRLNQLLWRHLPTMAALLSAMAAQAGERAYQVRHHTACFA